MNVPQPQWSRRRRQSCQDSDDAIYYSEYSIMYCMWCNSKYIYSTTTVQHSTTLNYFKLSTKVPVLWILYCTVFIVQYCTVH